MVVDALQKIADHFAVEEAQRQAHQLAQKVGDERHVEPRPHVQDDPALDELHAALAQKQHELRDEHQPDEVDVLIFDADIDHRLGEEGEEQLN